MLETMAASVIAGLLIKIGERAIDHFWTASKSGNVAAVNQQGFLPTTVDQSGRTHVTFSYAPARYATVFGEFYFSEELQHRATGWEVPVVLVADIDRGDTMLFDADIQAGYQIDLLPGNYFMIVLLIDGRATRFEHARVYAYGFPSREDLSGLDGFDIDHEDGMWAIVEDDPLLVPSYGQHYLDFLVASTAGMPELPTSVAQLIASPVDHLICPRCDGDGYVGWNDLRRLSQEGYSVNGWTPGSCRLCNATGYVTADYPLYKSIGSPY